MRVKIARNYNDSVTIERKWIFDAASLEATVQFTFTNSKICYTLQGFAIYHIFYIKIVTPEALIDRRKPAHNLPTLHFLTTVLLRFTKDSRNAVKCRKIKLVKRL
jgi:hypothetical protein